MCIIEKIFFPKLTYSGNFLPEIVYFTKFSYFSALFPMICEIIYTIHLFLLLMIIM